MEALCPDKRFPTSRSASSALLAEADRLAAAPSSAGASNEDVTETPQYQELVRLKVILEVETSRTLSETARISSELEQTGMGVDLAPVEEGG